MAFPVHPDIKHEILRRLETIEDEDSVRIVYACESGSRAWGFESKDSDFDVRFLYVNRPEWYLSVDWHLKRDVIERPISDRLDLCGWDLKKALGLFYKSNPPLIEWLGSPIVYREDTPVAERMRELLDTYYSPIACLYHYLHMAQGNFREFLQGDQVLRKKYLYVLRPVIAILWIEREWGVVPTRFETALDRVITDTALRSAIDQLLRDKIAGHEMSLGSRIEPISAFLETELARLQARPDLARPPKSDWAALNDLFRDSLEWVWSDA